MFPIFQTSGTHPGQTAVKLVGSDPRPGTGSVTEMMSKPILITVTASPRGPSQWTAKSGHA